MSRWQAIAGAVWAAGLIAGTLDRPPAPREPARVGEYWVLAADFHVHGFPGDGALAPWLLRAEAARAGLDAFVVTNHNRLSTAQAARWIASGSPGPIVLVGQEVTARGFHIAAAGVETPVDAMVSAADAVRAIHAQGGIAIAAHPTHDYLGGWTDEALSMLDGIERAHPSMRGALSASEFEAFAARTSRLRPRVAFIGSSDFHFNGHPGRCRTWVLARDRSAAGIIAAVREGMTVAEDLDGRLHGRAEHVALVQTARPATPAPSTPTSWQRLSVVAAWLGILGVALL